MDTFDVDSLIAAAAGDPTTETMTAVIRALDKTELFFLATVSNVDVGQRVTAPLARLKDGSHALIAYTSKLHPELPKKFSGSSWRHVLEMAEGMPQADWLIVINLGGDWLPISKEQIRVVIRGLEGKRVHGPSLSESETGGDLVNAELETLISEAAGLSPEKWAGVLTDNLQGRELFVRISPQRSADDQPVMITSKVGDVSGLVQAYTSRRRPGIIYGGMTWEAIAGMVTNSSDIPGVHIINENDDWVVLGQAEI